MKFLFIYKVTAQLFMFNLHVFCVVCECFLGQEQNLGGHLGGGEQWGFAVVVVDVD